MAFLVLVQGYELIGGPGIGFAVKLGVALLVGMTTVGVAYAVEDRLDGTNPSGADRDETGDESERR